MKSKKLYKLICVVAVLVIMSCVSLWTGVYSDLSEIKNVFTLVTWESLVQVAIMVCTVLVITWLLELILEKINSKSKRVGTAISVFSSLIRYMAFIIILCWGFALLGVNVSTILASVGILAIIIGFGAESLIEDVITGLFMLFEHQYDVGDIVEVEGFRGTVTNIGIRTTTIQDTGANKKIINNSAMKNILNRSTAKSVAVCDISISYENDLEALEKELPKMLQDIADIHAEIVDAPQYLGLQGFDGSAIVLRFIAYVNEDKIFDAQRIMNRELYLGLKKKGYEIPYKQIMVHK